MPDNKWNNLPAPPSPLFVGKKERDLIKQVNTELEERVLGQQILYYPLDVETSNYHSLYGEAIEKNYLPPIHIYCLVEPVNYETLTNQYGVDRKQYVTVHFHSRRLQEDQDLFLQEGDIFLYGDSYFEITEIQESQLIYGQIDNKMELQVKAYKVRDGFFNEEQ
jgi:hypothetical protein